MPEIKHQFTGGKMNKDLDERLVPNGEYRHAENIQVSTSEGSAVGTVQNILGNSLVSGQDFIEADAVCVGSIASESNNKIYYFIVNGVASYKGDAIIELDVSNNNIKPVLVSTSSSVLNFSVNNIITGVNIIDGMLFWTDNNSEPKKINIQRSIDGTSNGITHTSFLNPKTGTSIPIEEKHITVIKKAPPTAPFIELVTEREEQYTYTGVMRVTQPFVGSNEENPSSFNFNGMGNTVANTSVHDFSSFKVGDSFRTAIETDLDGESGFTLKWQKGDTVFFKAFEGVNPPTIPVTNYDLKAIIEDNFWTTPPSPNRFEDKQNEFADNGDFKIPNSSGTNPLYYNYSSPNANTGFVADYNSFDNRIEINQPDDGVTSNPTGQWTKIVWSGSNITWDTSGQSTYRITIKTSNVTHGSLNVYMVSSVNSGNNNNWFWRTQSINTDGTYTEDIVFDTANAFYSNNFNGYANKFFIQTSKIGFVGNIDSVSIVNLNEENAIVKFKITDIVKPPVVPVGDFELNVAVDVQSKEDKLYEFKFPRFATRYRYQDGEYSAFSPFTEVAFVPGGFDYHPKKGYNLGMSNLLKSVIIKQDPSTFPSDVVFIDILYKEDSSPNVYVLDSIKPNSWHDEYEITSEAINRAVPSNQLLRLWDNVPKKALAQDITGNRIVYANYEQGYDLVDENNDDYYADISVDFNQESIESKTKPSIKSERDYQVGVTFVDKYGRETPIVANSATSSSKGKKLSKSNADKANSIKVTLNSNSFMKDAEFFKFFVKETSGQYYNMAMDRFWDAEDGHVWISFASSDINKVDIDSYLILKKGVDSNFLINDPARYKVIAIEKEAPDFIKTKQSLLDAKEHIFGTSKDIFDDNDVDIPVEGEDYFVLNYGPFVESSAGNLDINKDGVIYIEFTTSGDVNTSRRYRVNSIETDWRKNNDPASNGKYIVRLDEKLGSDVNFITDDTKIIDGTVVRFYKYKVENSPEFDGRFFVKVLNDSIFTQNISKSSSDDDSYEVFTTKKIYYLKQDIATTHAGSITGQTDGMYEDGGVGGDFGRYAAFFRNYDSAPNEEQIDYRDTAGGTVPVSTNVGQYVFGGDKWKNEFLNYTSSGKSTTGSQAAGWQNSGSVNAWNISGSNSGRSFHKDADDYPNQDGEEVWFIDEGNYDGYRSAASSPSLHWPWIGQVPGVMHGITGQSSVPAASKATIRIGIGGIYHNQICDPNNQGIDNFFTIGQAPGNSFYQDSKTKDIVSGFTSGKKFRFKEDPKQTIYTVQDYTVSKLLRYNHGGDGTATPHPGPYYSHPSQIHDREIAQLAPNATKTWNLNIKNPDDNGSMGWDPTGDLGPIMNDGLSLEINHSTSVSGVPTPGVAVRVSSLVATNSNDNINYTIKKGMILCSHSNGSVNYDGSAGMEYLVVYKTAKSGGDYLIYLTGYSKVLVPPGFAGAHGIFSTAPTPGQKMVFRQAKMNGYSNFSANRINAQQADNANGYNKSNPGLYAVGYTIEFLIPKEPDNKLPTNPAVWETEPKENTPLEIYYEAGGLNPIMLKEETKHIAIPTGSTVEHVENNASISLGTTILSVGFDGPLTANYPADSGWYLYFSIPDAAVGGATNPFVGYPYIEPESKLKITKPDGSSITVKVSGYETDPNGTTTSKIYISQNLYNSNTEYTLNWHNCFSFGNGVESNRIKDGFNLPFISNGVRVSTVLEEEEDYKRERRKYGLIYSGIYNGIGGINNLNQFIAAEKITKDLNPIYGSIQKLHSRDSDLIALCEDKVLQIYANKDVLFNADGNVNVTATNKVLGQSRPFVGEYGISTNPESFTSESYRVYFTDKVRGAVLRLSKDGLTPISDAGMKDYFKDNLKDNDKIIGSYDDRKDEYNITLPTTNTTISYKEDVRGWVSFKSFVPENGISCSNDYYTFKDGKIYKHHDESTDRNTFYEEDLKPSVLEVVLNDSPDVIKSFHTLNYSGEKDWSVSKIYTNKQEGSVSEFIEKEGRWSNYIKGIDADLDSNSDFGALNIQGIGKVESIDIDNKTIHFSGNVNSSLQTGDVLYRKQNLEKISNVVSVYSNKVKVNSLGNVSDGDYVFFAKNNIANVSSLLGHYASAIFENNSTDKTEIFSVGSEITQSSK